MQFVTNKINCLSTERCKQVAISLLFGICAQETALYRVTEGSYNHRDCNFIQFNARWNKDHCMHWTRTIEHWSLYGRSAHMHMRIYSRALSVQLICGRG